MCYESQLFIYEIFINFVSSVLFFVTNVFLTIAIFNPLSYKYNPTAGLHYNLEHFIFLLSIANCGVKSQNLHKSSGA